MIRPMCFLHVDNFGFPRPGAYGRNRCYEPARPPDAAAADSRGGPAADHEFV